MLYVFKLNVGAQTIKNFEDDMSYLKNNVILTALETVFEIKEINSIFQLQFIDDNKDHDFIVRVGELEKLTDELLEMYIEVIEKFREEGSVLYTPNFLNLTSKCGIKRNQLVEDFSFLEEADSMSDNKVLEYFNIPTENRVGTAITHLKKFYKLKLFIEENEIEELLYGKNKIYFQPDDEQLIIEAYNEEEAKTVVKDLVSQINKSSKSIDHIGRINIQPIYEKVEIKGDIKSITFTVVYPNGASRERHELIEKQLRGTEGDKQTTTINSSNILNVNFINKMLKPLGEKGYIESIDVPKKSEVIMNIKTLESINLDEGDNHE